MKVMPSLPSFGGNVILFSAGNTRFQVLPRLHTLHKYIEWRHSTRGCSSTRGIP